MRRMAESICRLLELLEDTSALEKYSAFWRRAPSRRTMPAPIRDMTDKTQLDELHKPSTNVASTLYAHESRTPDKRAGRTYHFGDEPLIENVHLFHIRQELNPKYAAGVTEKSSMPSGVCGDSPALENDAASQSRESVSPSRTQKGNRKLIEYKRAWQRPPVVVAKRNARERTRVHTVNEAFVILKCHLPSIRSNSKRVSKLKILKAAISYIYALTDMLQDFPPQRIARPTVTVPRAAKSNPSKLVLGSYRSKAESSRRVQPMGSALLSTMPQRNMNAFMGSAFNDPFSSYHNVQQIVDSLYPNPPYLPNANI